MIARDRIRRIIRALKRYGYTKLIAYFVMVASEVLDDELSSVSYALATKENTQWLYVMCTEPERSELSARWSNLNTCHRQINLARGPSWWAM